MIDVLSMVSMHGNREPTVNCAPHTRNSNEKLTKSEIRSLFLFIFVNFFRGHVGPLIQGYRGHQNASKCKTLSQWRHIYNKGNN